MGGYTCKKILLAQNQCITVVSLLSISTTVLYLLRIIDHMNYRKEIEKQIERYTPFFIKQLEKPNDDELEGITVNSSAFASLSHTLASICNYESSKRMESYSERLTVQMNSL